jgi:hypothetical protein
VAPNWYGHSIAHFEGNTLAVDTVGFKTGPVSMVDEFVTPHSGALNQGLSGFTLASLVPGFKGLRRRRRR